MRRLLLATIILSTSSHLAAAEPCATLDNKAVAGLFDDWNFALSSLDSSQVAQRYWPNAVLLPTVSNTPRTDPAMIRDYFDHFLVKRPRGRIDSRTIQSACNMAVDMGTYTFSLMDDKGVTNEVAARYTFVYQYRDGAWKILHHHSSAMPERAADTMSADAHATSETPPPVAKAEKVALGDAQSAWARKQKKANRKEAAKAAAAAESAPVKSIEAPAEKLAAASAEATKAGADPKKTADTKSAADSKTPADAKTADAKPAAAPETPVEVKTSMFANLTSSPPPSKFYPPEAARRKERGSVNLKVCANNAGAVTDTLEVVKSSGSKLLDDAAISWARAATWVPATLNRRSVEGCTQVDVAFEANPATAIASR